MALSQDLVNQFVKITNDTKKDKSEVTVKGTYKVINNIEYVQLDGSDILTPVTSVVDAEDGERVNVLIKDHTATVTGNISSPAARTKTVSDLKDEVDEQGNTIKQLDTTIEQQNASIIQINTDITQINTSITQANSRINQQGDNITSMNNTINQIGNTVNQQGNTIEQLDDDIKSVGNTIVSINNTINQQGNTITQQGNTIIQQGNIISEQGNEMQIFDSNIRILNSGFVIENGVLTGLSQIILNTLTAQYAEIDFANIQMAAVEKLFTESGIIKDLVVSEQHISGELVGVTIKGDLIEGNTVKADKLVILGSDGLYYKLNITGETVESEQTNVNSLNGQVIAAQSITASKIAVDDLVAFDATIGGFHISQHGIYSGVKESISNTTAGIHLDDAGQVYIGDDTNYLKFIQDEQGGWKLDISASTINFGIEGKSIDTAFGEVNNTIADNESKIKAIMRYAIINGSGTLTIGNINSDSNVNYFTRIDNDEIRFVTITGDPIEGTETVIARMDNRSLTIDKVIVREELTIANKFRWRNLSGNGMILEKVN